MAEGASPPPVVYVPTGDHPATSLIASGSGIVGRPDGGSLIEVHFEGAVHRQVNLLSYADRVAHAHGRMVEKYPTVAKMVVPRDALVVVGTFLPQEGRVELTGPDSETLVAAWLEDGERRLDPAELLCRRAAR